MVELAKRRSRERRHIGYIAGDVMVTPLPCESFDVVVTVAMLHQLTLPDAIGRLTTLVAPGGYLLIQDVVDRPGLVYIPVNVSATFARRLREFPTSAGRGRAAALCRRHGRGERYLDVRRLRATFEELLPGATVMHHLEWRYSVIWRRG